MKNKHRNKRKARLFYAYISPWIIGLFCFTFIPMTISLVFSFTDVKMANATQVLPNFIGFQNYIDLFVKDSDFKQALLNTFVYAGSKVIFTVMFALLIALLLNSKVVGKKFYRTMIYLPAVIPVVSVALLWKLIFTGDTMNISNFFLSYLGFAPVSFFGTPGSAMATVVFVGIWSGLGPVMLILLAAIQGIPEDIVEAAKLDGAGPLSQLRYIIIPSISSAIFFVALTGIIGSLQAYAEIKLLTAGGPGLATTVINLLIVKNAFNSVGSKTLGYASAQAWVGFLITLTLTIVFIRMTRKAVYNQSEVS